MLFNKFNIGVEREHMTQKVSQNKIPTVGVEQSIYDDLARYCAETGITKKFAVSKALSDFLAQRVGRAA